MQLVFDLDGCVVDNRKATKEAYEAAGVKAFPADWYHISGWATELERRHKNALYAECLEMHGRILPAGKLLLQTGGLVLSGCSPESVDAFLRVFPKFYRNDIVICPKHSLEDKLRWLQDKSTLGLEGGLYFDDWAFALDQVRGRTTWRAIDASRL